MGGVLGGRGVGIGHDQGVERAALLLGRRVGGWWGGMADEARVRRWLFLSAYDDARRRRLCLAAGTTPNTYTYLAALQDHPGHVHGLNRQELVPHRHRFVLVRHAHLNLRRERVEDVRDHPPVLQGRGGVVAAAGHVTGGVGKDGRMKEQSKRRG